VVGEDSRKYLEEKEASEIQVMNGWMDGYKRMKLSQGRLTCTRQRQAFNILEICGSSMGAVWEQDGTRSS